MTQFVTIGKSKQFYDFLKNEIQSGEYKPGDKFPSIRDLAAKYGISSITVNSVISNLVNEGLLYVEQGKGTFVAERRQDARKKKKMIGVMFFDFSQENNVEASMFNSIQETLTDDYYVIPYNSYNMLELFYKGIKGLAELDVDGMILVPPTTEDYDPEIIKGMLTREIPIVFINRVISTIHADFFAMDFEQAVYKAAKYLIEKNRKNIALIKSDSATLSMQMYQGCIRAHKEAGIAFNDGLLVEWHRGMDKAEITMKAILGTIDGLIGSDVIIYRLRKTMEASGRKVPGDVAVVGINDTVYSRFMNPPLTAVPFPSRWIGTESAKALMDRIENGRTEPVRKAYTGDLVVRESC